jgi:hypothetical protein
MLESLIQIGELYGDKPSILSEPIRRNFKKEPVILQIIFDLHNNKVYYQDRKYQPKLVEDFMVEMGKVAKECRRILKTGGHCDIFIGDTRKHRRYVPIHIGVLAEFLEAGFVFMKDAVKLQHHTKTTRERWRNHKYDFYKIAHEHLYVFRKLKKGEAISDYKYSIKWW